MARFLKVFFAGFVMIASHHFAVAGSLATLIPNKETQTRIYAGLVWNLNNKIEVKPDFVSVGARSVAVKSNDNVSGADLSIRFGLKNGVKFDSSRLSYVGGNRDAQGNLGFGYSYAEQSFFGTLGASSAYSRLGGDWMLKSNSFTPFFEVNTLPKPKKVNATDVDR